MFCYNKASGFDTNYAVINSKLFFYFFKLETSCSKKKKNSMGFPLYMSLFCALFTKEQRSTSFIRQRGQKQDFTDHRRACGLDCRPFHRKEVWSLGGMRTVWVRLKEELPSPPRNTHSASRPLPSLCQVAGFMSEEKVGFLRSQRKSDTSLDARTHFRRKGEPLQGGRQWPSLRTRCCRAKASSADCVPDINACAETLGRWEKTRN